MTQQHSLTESTVVYMMLQPRHTLRQLTVNHNKLHVTSCHVMPAVPLHCNMLVLSLPDFALVCAVTRL